MASSLISSSHHVDFESVFGFDDAVNGVTVEISEKVFAESFELPIDGLTDLSDVPKNLVLDARSLFYVSKEQVGMENTAASPRVKKTPVKKAVSKKRQFGAVEEAPGALEAVPLHIIETTAEMPAEQPSKPKRKTQKRKRRLVLDDADETGDSVPEQPAAEIAAGAQVPIVDDPVATQPDIVPTFEATTDDPVAMIEKILNQLDTVAGTDGGDQPAAPATESTSWFDLPFMLARREAEGLLSSDTDEDLEQNFTEIDTAGTTAGTKVAEEHMSIDDLLLQIPDDMLPRSVTVVEITKIRLGESISINEVQERDLYYASLPRISVLDKGKEILEEDEPVKGNPAREMVELICGDVEFLVQLRDRVMKDVVEFFHSFSLNKLTNLDALLELKEKEKLMLEWAETDSLETAVKRKVYILAKYREMLLRKFVESHRKYYTPGQPWTATSSQIIYLLTVAHSKSLEALVAHQKEHGLPVEQPCTSTFLDASVGSGAVLAQFYSMAKSTCWVRPLVLIDGVWTPIQGTDFWRSSCKLSLFVNRKKLPETVIEDTFVPHVFFIEPVQYWGAAPALIKTWGWHRVCIDVIRFSMFGCLRPIREDVCTDIVVYNLGVERIPASFCRSFAQGVDTDSFVRYFSDSDVESLAEIDLSSSDAPTVYRSPSPIFQEADSFEHNLQFALGPAIFSGGAQEELPYFVESPESPSPISPRQESSSSCTDVSMHFDKDDILLDDNANVQPTLSDVPADISPFFDDLKTYLSQRMDTANNDILSRLHTVERGIRDTLGQQNDYFRGLIQSVRQDAQTQDNIQTLRFNEFRKNILAQNASIFTGLADVRKEVQEINAKVDIMATNFEIVKKDVEASKEAISHQLLEFQAQDSRGPQPPPPPVYQIRGTGVNVSTPDFAQRVEIAQRNIMERVMDTDRRERFVQLQNPHPGLIYLLCLLDEKLRDYYQVTQTRIWNKISQKLIQLEQQLEHKKVAEEHMSIDDLLLQIPDDMLPRSVTVVEITKIRLGESISINEVQERDLYYASLPRISVLDKGKEILEEDEPVKGNPARETVELICGDVEFLVQLRDRVMKDVVEFFHSFSLNKLTNLDALLELKEKEKLMLEWAETDSLETAVKRKSLATVEWSISRQAYPDESYSESVLVFNETQATVDCLTRRKLQWIA
ncbi:cell division control protein 2C [Dorcoceras hygrometricum]|uniref:Cell division control protein 2C n=1 Tax=Dorcoceras hygrometricum TaxID=472368 RepID=A0A2Z7CCC3_9LAMI|nr:cell division control protein 2C [Dorcoceras hygrometricum]